MHKTVGRFSVEVSLPYPCWCQIYCDGGDVINFNHKDLADLEHLVKEMRKAATAMLPDSYKGEA